MASSAPSTPSPRAREIAAAARALLDEEGVESLTMRRVAERLGIRAPSIYKHLAGKEALEAAVISEGFAELAATFETAAAGADDPLGALAAAYRRFGLEKPHLYRLMTERPLKRDLLEPGVEGRAARPLLGALGGDEALARAAWAFAHGMTILELNGRFPAGADLDAAWREGLRGFRGS
jgi:AcrR family transcriptional regulator